MSFVHKNTLILSGAVSAEAGPGLLHAHWGYRLVAEGSTSLWPKISRAVSRFVGLILLLSIAGIWTYGAGFTGESVMLFMKLGLTGLLFGAGGLLMSYGGEGKRPETQVDLQRREIRTGRMTAKGQFVLEGRLAFSDIGSVIVMRRSDEDTDAVLYARMGNGMAALELMSGPVAQMEALQCRIIEDVATVMARVNVAPKRSAEIVPLTSLKQASVT